MKSHSRQPDDPKDTVDDLPTRKQCQMDIGTHVDGRNQVFKKLLGR